MQLPLSKNSTLFCSQNAAEKTIDDPEFSQVEKTIKMRQKQHE